MHFSKKVISGVKNKTESSYSGVFIGVSYNFIKEYREKIQRNFEKIEFSPFLPIPILHITKRRRFGNVGTTNVRDGDFVAIALSIPAFQNFTIRKSPN